MPRAVPTQIQPRAPSQQPQRSYLPIIPPKHPILLAPKPVSPLPPIANPSLKDLSRDSVNRYITYSVDKVSEGQPSGLQEELQWSKDQTVTLLFRESLYKLVSLFQEWNDNPSFNYDGKLLRGAYGAGKFEFVKFYS